MRRALLIYKLVSLPPLAEKECRETWHHLQHMANKEAALLAAEKGKAAAAAEGPAGEAPAGTAAALAEQSDLSR